MPPLVVTKDQISQTLNHLKQAGNKECECVVLWLGRIEGDFVSIIEVYRPDQVARADIFRINRESMAKVLDLLDSKELMIAAQVHSHPHEAFHSTADDQWAIVRHVNALSLVVPDFGLQTDSKTFMRHMKLFKLSSKNKWIELATDEVNQWLIVKQFLKPDVKTFGPWFWQLASQRVKQLKNWIKRF